MFRSEWGRKIELLEKTEGDLEFLIPSYELDTENGRYVPNQSEKNGIVSHSWEVGMQTARGFRLYICYAERGEMLDVTEDGFLRGHAAYLQDDPHVTEAVKWMEVGEGD